MSKSGDDLDRETDEFIKISNEALKGMNDVINGALKEPQPPPEHVSHLSQENNKNFEGLKLETEKFKVTTGNEKRIVLVIDDDATHLGVTKNYLEEDYSVATASSCDQALKLLYQGLDPSFVLLDLMMPDVSGWDTYEQIRDLSNLHKVPIAIYTSSEDPEDMDRAREMGAADFIKKPCKKSELLERVKKNINK
jgi:PleD family two-component response regulator